MSLSIKYFLPKQQTINTNYRLKDSSKVAEIWGKTIAFVEIAGITKRVSKHTIGIVIMRATD